MRDKKLADPKLRALANLIVRARENAGGWSQERLADHLGVARSTIARWESAKGGIPALENLLALVNDFGIPGEDLAEAVGLLPTPDQPARFSDPDVQAIWDLGERRGWTEDARYQLIDVWRGRQLREAVDSDEAEALAAIADAEESEQTGRRREDQPDRDVLAP